MLTKEQIRQNAIKNLKAIGCYGPYVMAFANGTLTMYEGYGGYYIDEDSEVFNQVRAVEQEYGGMVYAVIHSITSYGELYTFLWATSYEEDAEYDVEEYELLNSGHTYSCSAYVWNKTDPTCSEFGTVIIQPALGGLIRVY